MPYFWICFLVVMASLRASAGTVVQFRTAVGDVTAELLDAEKPVTVANFLRYVRDVYPTNAVFLHRCIPGFALQGGGYQIAFSNQFSSNPFAEWYRVDRYAPITNEFLVGPKLSNTFGTLAMAKAATSPDSATSEWFFNLGDNSDNLDAQNGGFTVFGRVVGGTNVLNYFNGLSKLLTPTDCFFRGIVDMRCIYGNFPSTQLYSDLPVRYLTNRTPNFEDLFYVDISLWNLAARVTSEGLTEIRWNSVKDRTQVVEYTTDVPPSWNTLTKVVGDGSLQKVVDPATPTDRRFYRVRLE